jgi:hypothetical protein
MSRAATLEAWMTSIPVTPKDQFLFFIDNPLVAAEPGGETLIAAFRALVDALLDGGAGDGSSAMPGALGSGLFFASAPVEGEPAGESGKGGGNHGDDAGAAVGLVLGLLGGLARGDLDI